MTEGDRRRPAAPADPESAAAARLFAGAGAMRARCRELDWGATPLGPVEAWPQSLRSTARTVLAHPLPHLLLWGPELVQIPNDAYMARVGGAHPAELGEPVREFRARSRDVAEPIFQRVLDGESLVLEDAPFPFDRSGHGQSGTPALSFSPVHDDSGDVAGVLVALFSAAPPGGDISEPERREAERALAERSLRKSEARYRALFASMDEAYAVVEMVTTEDGASSDFRFVEVNPAFLQHTGMEAPVGRTATELLGTPNPRWTEVFGRVSETGDPVRFEESEPVLGRVFDLYAFRIDVPERRRVAVLFTDVTERRRDEERQEYLLDLSDTLGPLADPAEIKAAATRLLGAHLGVNRVLYADVEGDDWYVEDGYVDGVDPLPKGRHPMEPFGPWIVDEFRAGRMLVIQDVRSDPRFSLAERQTHEAYGILGAAAVPLVKDGALVAILVAHNGSARDWTSQELTLLQETAERTWAAVELDRLRRRTDEHNGFLVRFADAVRPLIDPDGVARSACRLLLEALGVERAYWAEVDWATGDFVVETSISTPGVSAIGGRFPLEAWEPLTAHHLAGRPVVVNDTRADPRIPPAMREAYARIGVGADLGVPVVVSGRLRCVLVVNQRAPRRWTREELALVEGIAGRCWAEVQRARSEAALRESEERFRLFADASSDVLWIRGAEDASWEYLSPAFETIYGYPRSKVMGPDDLQTWADLIVPEDRDHALSAIEQVRGGARLSFEYRIRRSDGELRWLRNTDFPIGEAGGRARRIGGIGQDITEQKRAEAVLRELNETLEQRVEERTAELRDAVEVRGQVLLQLVTAEEEERRRISRELHDQLGQQLTGLLLGLRSARSRAESPELADRLRALERLAGETARDAQSLAVELRPPALDALGLVAAVQSHLEDWGARHGIACDFHTRGLAGIRLSHETETTLYRVVQEALTNVLKHANASRVSLMLERRAGRVRVVLEDDGAGFDVDAVLRSPEKADRLGVRGMRERVRLLGGELEIESAPGTGTSLYVRLPEAVQGRPVSAAAQEADA